MNRIGVFDASAVLAYLQSEKGADILESALDVGPCWITTVNLCEVIGKLCAGGVPPNEARSAVDDLGMVVMDFDSELAVMAAFLRVPTRAIGASLGDRACLALAERAVKSRFVPIVYTSERAWARLKWPFKMEVIR